MGFSFTPDTEENRLINTRRLREIKDSNALSDADRERQKKEREYQQSLQSGNDEIRSINDKFAQQKALDKAKKQAADYSAGVVDPEEAASKTRLDAKKAEGELSDFGKYSQKNDYDRKNQDAAWASASKYRQSDAAQQIRNREYMQQTDIDQTNRLRRDDNTRAIDGFKMNF